MTSRLNIKIYRASPAVPPQTELEFSFIVPNYIGEGGMFDAATDYL
jgi:hypothetical protein